jgi:dihydroxyacetone kinase phosphotransfer subunit
VIGIVVVSHSPALAQAAVDLARQMGGGSPPAIRIAAGTAGGATGTDAVAIAAAIDEVASPDGVLVVMDIGSAILSAGMALEFSHADVPVRLTDAPFVEGLIAAIVIASTGASLEMVDAEARSALDGKTAQLEGVGDRAPVSHDELEDTPAQHADLDATATFEAVLGNPSGLHARPAAVFVKTVGRFDAEVRVTDLSSGKGPASAASLISLMALGAANGSRVRVEATGPDAEAVVRELEELVADGFGER